MLRHLIVLKLMLALRRVRLFSLALCSSAARLNSEFIIKPALELKVISVYQQLSVYINLLTRRELLRCLLKPNLEANRSLEAIPQSNRIQCNCNLNQKRENKKLITSQVLRSLSWKVAVADFFFRNHQLQNWLHKIHKKVYHKLP